MRGHCCLAAPGYIHINGICRLTCFSESGSTSRRLRASSHARAVRACVVGPAVASWGFSRGWIARFQLPALCLRARPIPYSYPSDSAPTDYRTLVADAAAGPVPVHRRRATRSQASARAVSVCAVQPAASRLRRFRQRINRYATWGSNSFEELKK